MKVCTICGTENGSESVRCSVCHTLLPEQEVAEPPITVSDARSVRMCDKCGAICNKNAVRCDRCGSFLTATRSYSDFSKQTDQVIEPLNMSLDSGEVIALTHGQIIGRQYQPKIWDAYTPRAVYMIIWDNGRYSMKSQKDSSVTPIKFGHEYVIGRRRVVFSDK